LAVVGFLKMTRLFEKADQLLAMSRGNVITGLTFSRHSSGVSGSFPAFWRQKSPNESTLKLYILRLSCPEEEPHSQDKLTVY
jgi:hypothetical protein